MTEHEALEQIRDSLTDAKTAMRSAIKGARAMMQINADAGRHREANAAFGLMGELRQLLGATEAAHANGTELLFQYWPEEAVPEGDGGVIKAGHR